MATMLSRNSAMQASRVNKLSNRLLSLLFICALILSTGSLARASQESFQTPEAAVDALIAAAKSSDLAAATDILGPDTKQVISSGDPVADKSGLEQFIAGYDRMHRLAYDSEGHVILYIGAVNWPFPIPIVKRRGGWQFDTPAGLKELLYRRIGSNELFTIATLRTLVDAQSQYADAQGRKAYAQRIMSTPGSHDGLYWPVTASEPQSPIGPLIAAATAAGYGANSGQTKPFHGYIYRILTSQGPEARGGAKDYLVDGKMTEGFAFIAYPTNYRSTGVMTFVVNQDGTILQKDLGPKTVEIASTMKEFNPDKSWMPVPEYGD
jgi:hypothetical protein